MRIVVLESSPHKHGASNLLADYFINGAMEAGHTISVLDVARMNIRPCLGCFKGYEKGHCILLDDMSAVEHEIEKADMVVYVTPVYFYDMCAQLKLVVDRLHCCYHKLQGKKSLLLTTACRDDDEVMSYLENLYEGLVRYLGYENMGTIMARGCCTADA